MADNEDWSSSEDEAPEEQSVSSSRKSQLKQQQEQQKLLKEQKLKEKEQRRQTQQRRELEKIEREQKKLEEKLLQEEKSDESDDDEDEDAELPMEVLKNVEEVKPTRVVFNEEKQELEKVPNLRDFKRARLEKLRAIRKDSKVVDNIKVQKITKATIKSRKLDSGLQNFKANWLNRRSIKRS